ncbi:hypothetical protein K2173_005055 [Erythroxylum novogranatense]|uniref:WAT1-related protein n=1 Tax=Erythroxylum novogranatense TaxID=1862640 RepID=A0AAV8U8F3_9ROSI|nr:hypothetical protein K2173_005055 [Erythroxylum novogranatense]
MSSNKLMRPVLVMVAVNIAFAIGNVLIKKVLDEGVNHMVLVTYRLSIATIFLAPIAYYWERRSRPKLTACILCQLFLSALAGITITQYLFLLGLKFTSATLSCAFLNMVSVITFLLALTTGQEKVHMKSKAGTAKVLGAIICMSGGILLAIYKGGSITNLHSRSAETDIKNHANTMILEKRTQRRVVGSMLLLAGSTTWSSWFLIQAKVGRNYPCQYSSTAILSFFGAIQSALVTCAMRRDIRIWILKGKLEILCVVYTGVVGSGLSYVVMSWCVKKRGPVFTVAFTPLAQIFAAMFDFHFLHEQIYLGSVLGSIVIILGLYILLWGKSIEADEYLMKEAEAVSVKQDEHGVTEAQVSVAMDQRTCRTL